MFLLRNQSIFFDFRFQNRLKNHKKYNIGSIPENFKGNKNYPETVFDHLNVI